jgi:hypothetical protein
VSQYIKGFRFNKGVRRWLAVNFFLVAVAIVWPVGPCWLHCYLAFFLLLDYNFGFALIFGRF